MRQSFWKKVLAAWLSFLLIFMASLVPGLDGTAAEGAVTVSAPSAILLEAQTGTVIFEKDADRICSPASITKIMTLLLIFEALGQGQIHLTDEVVTSEHAQSMGGSQVFLEAGEVQTVETLIKCIAVASGNDAAVAMAEYVCGSEEAFVTKMNEKAQSLGMTNTHFTDCCGLTDDDSHHTTARDVAIMSRELVQKYPDIYQYTGIWMEDITHTTARGSTPFTLSSTNKLLKQYQWATGLKTGSTAKAKYCLSATARKDGIDLITVVMTAPDSRARFLDAATLFSYGYSVSALYRDDNKDQLLPVPVKGGQEETVPVVYASEFVWLDTDGNDISMVQKRISVPKEAEAPVVVGTKGRRSDLSPERRADRYGSHFVCKQRGKSVLQRLCEKSGDSVFAVSFVERGSKRMLQEQMRIKAGNGFTDSKREDAYVEDSGHFVMSDSTYTAGCDDM